MYTLFNICIYRYIRFSYKYIDELEVLILLGIYRVQPARLPH